MGAFNLDTEPLSHILIYNDGIQAAKENAELQWHMFIL